MDLRLISCNIRFDNPADGDNAWNHRRNFLAETLRRHTPHLIATQEGRIHQLRDFETIMNFKMIDDHRSWIGERMYPSFFIDLNHFEYLASGDSWLSETPDIAGSVSFDSAFPRLMTWVKLQLKESSERLFIVNTHLDHVKSETRLNQVKVLISEIKKVWQRDSKLILMGDFNEGPDGAVRTEVVKHFPQLVDAWKTFNAEEMSSHHAFQGEVQNGSRIDWIMTDETIQLETCHMDKTSKDGKYPTDHFPVVCHISL